MCVFVFTVQGEGIVCPDVVAMCVFVFTVQGEGIVCPDVVPMSVLCSPCRVKGLSVLTLYRCLFCVHRAG